MITVRLRACSGMSPSGSKGLSLPASAWPLPLALRQSHSSPALSEQPQAEARYLTEREPADGPECPREGQAERSEPGSGINAPSRPMAKLLKEAAFLPPGPSEIPQALREELACPVRSLSASSFLRWHRLHTPRRSQARLGVSPWLWAQAGLPSAPRCLLCS